MPFIGKLPPLIFLVILPTVATSGVIVAPNSFAIILLVTTIIGLFYYVLIRPRYLEKYLKQGFEQAVIEFEVVKKIILFLLSIIIFLLSLELLTRVPTFVFITFFGLLQPGISSLLVYGQIISKKESRFYISKIYFTIALRKEDIFNRMRYFDKGLQEYNKYLKRHLKHQIKDIDKVFSKVSLLDKDAKTKVIRKVSNSFETEVDLEVDIDNEADKLKPLKCISSELMNSEDIESVLVPESLKSQLKVIGTFLAAAIPIVISIITLLRGH